MSEQLNNLLLQSSQMALKQPLKDKHLFLTSGFTAAGYANMIENDPQQKLQSKHKTYALIAFGSETFNSTQLKMYTNTEEILAIVFAFSEIGHSMWGSIFSVIVFNGNRAVTIFFRTKCNPPALWNACDYVQQYVQFRHSTYSRSYELCCRERKSIQQRN